MKKTYVILIVVLIFLSLTACGKNKSPAGEGSNINLKVLSEDEELRYVLERQIYPQDESEKSEQFCIFGENIYFIARKRGFENRGKAGNASLYKSSLSEEKIEKLDVLPEEYLLESICAGEGKTFLLFSSGEEYYLAELMEDKLGDFKSLKAKKRDQFSDINTALYKGNLLIRSRGSLSYVDIPSGEEINRFSSSSEADLIIGIKQNDKNTYVLLPKDDKIGFFALEELFNGNKNSRYSLPAVNIMPTDYTFGGENELICADCDGLYKIDEESGEKTKLARWLDMDITGSGFAGMVLRHSDGAIYMRGAKGEILKLVETVRKKRETLTLAESGLTESVTEAMLEFERRDEDFKVELIAYPWKQGDRLITEMLAGKSPDIIDLMFLNVLGSKNEDFFINLLPFLQNDKNINKDDLYMDIINADTENGALYSIRTEISIFALKMPYCGEDFIANPDFDQLLELAKNSGPPNKEWAGTPMNQRSFFEAALPVIEKDVLIGPKGERKIDREALQKWFELSAELPKYNVRVLELSSEDIGHIALEKYFAKGERLSIMGFLGKNISGAYAGVDSTAYAVSKSCKNPEKAWEFVRTGLLLNCGTLSVNKKTLKNP